MLTLVLCLLEKDSRCLSGLKEELSATRSKSVIEEVQLTENEVYGDLNRIDTRKPSGREEISGRLLREGAPHIAKPLLHFLDCPPQDWTMEDITPVFKRGNKHSLNPLTTNYDYSPHQNSAACYQLVQSVLKIGSALARWDEGRWVGVTVHGGCCSWL